MPEKRYGHEDEVEMATSVATEDTEHLISCVIRKPGFPTGLVGEAFSHDLLMQPLCATNRGLLDTFRQTG